MSQPAQKPKKKKKDRAPKVFSQNYAKVAHIPELIEHILSFLPQRSLRHSAVLVCHLWRRAALNLIVRTATITLDPANQHQLDPLNKDKFDQGAIDRINGAQILVIKPPVVDPYWGNLGPPRLGPLHRRVLLEQMGDLAEKRNLKIVDLQIQYYMDYLVDILPLLKITGFQLTSLSLSKMRFMEFFPLDSILYACPKLLYLSITQDIFSVYRLWHPDISDQTPPSPLPDRLPLRSLYLQGIGIEVQCLMKLLCATPDLTDLELISLSDRSILATARATTSNGSHLSAHSSHSLHNTTALQTLDFVSLTNMQSIEKIALVAPQITCLSISMAKPSMIKGEVLVQALQKFPSLSRWIMPGFDISSRTLERFRTSIADRVTDLEITGNLNQNIVGPALHRYMCETPHLKHLRASEIKVSVAWLDVEGILNKDSRYRRRHDVDSKEALSSNVDENQELSTHVWSTKNLKTLHLGFGASSNGAATFSSYEASRMVYGYISKTCPNLQDLLIKSPGLMLCLEGGVSLLSRLEKIRQLVIFTRSQEILKKDDLEWLALDLDPLRNIEKKRLLDRFITVEDHTIYSKTPFQSTLDSQDLPLKGRQKLLKPTISAFLPPSRRYREQKKYNSDTESEDDVYEHPKEKVKRSKAVSNISLSLPLDLENDVSDYLMSGFDMRGLGHLQDIGSMFLKRSKQRWQCWPQLEYLEFRNYGQIDDNEMIEKWVRTLRPRIEFKWILEALATIKKMEWEKVNADKLPNSLVSTVGSAERLHNQHRSSSNDLESQKAATYIDIKTMAEVESSLHSFQGKEASVRKYVYASRKVEADLDTFYIRCNYDKHVWGYKRALEEE
ncbi:hypothetical protein FBU30_005279 [Linnemannia zychae]|nr:hypothetical protein FBU30_005279 [Linnemannia zychae]